MYGCVVQGPIGMPRQKLIGLTCFLHHLLPADMMSMTHPGVSCAVGTAEPYRKRCTVLLYSGPAGYEA